MIWKLITCSSVSIFCNIILQFIKKCNSIFNITIIFRSSFFFSADCEGSLQFVPFDHEIYLAIPRPTDTIDKHYYDTPGSILLDVGINHPLYNEISALKDIFNQVDKKRIVEKFGKVELPKKLKFMKFLLHDEDVQKELNNNKNLKDTADIILLLMNLTSESIFGPNFVTDAHDFINLIDFIPDPDNDVETYNVELLYDLLADPEELNNLFDVESLVDNSLSEQELLIEIINSLLVNSTSSKYTFTDGLITILDKLIDNSNKAYHTMDDTSDAYAAHSIRPHDTLVVEVDPSRLDRKPRFTHPDHYSNETDRPKSTYTMQCTIPSPVLTVLESDIEHLDQLIPLTPGKYIYHVDDKLIRQLKNLLKDNKLRKKILDENFDIVKYPTKVLLMEGVFEALDQLVENGIIDIDPDLQNFIDIYYYVLDFTNEELGVSPKAIMRYNYEHLLTLLPTPTESDKKKYEAIQSFLLDDDIIDYIVRNMDPIQYNKQAQILSYILNACTNSEDQEIRSACNYYLKTIKDLRSADQSLEKYVTYKKSKLNNIEITYVQLNPSNLTASSVTPTLQPEKEGILQIPIPNTKLLIDPRDMTYPEEMIPDVVPAFPLHYNLTDLQWQLRRPDASRIIMEKIDRKDKALKVETLEDVIDHLIISALSDKFHLQEHSLKFANTYCLALKVANKRITNISTKNDYVELLKKHLESTGNKKDIAKCDKLFEVLDNNDLMTRILGPIYPILRPKYYSDFYFILSVLKMIDMSRNPDVAHIKDINKEIIEVLRASLYKHDQLLIETKDVDISDALTATFNSKTFPRNLTSTYIKVSRFLMRDFDKKKHLPGFDYRDYKTKGQLIIGMFKTMISKNTVPEEIKGHMKQLLPHASLDGLAAYPI